MAREATISQEEVNAVADTIRASGMRPTARAVREELGRGSMATVLRLLQNWQTGQGQAPETPVVLPTALQRLLSDFIAQEVASAKLTVEQELVSAQQAQRDLIAESEAQAADIESLQQLFETLKDTHRQLQGRSTQLTTDLEEARRAAEAQRQAAETARNEIAKLQLRIEGIPRIEAELTKQKEELEAERKARVAAEQAAAVSAAKLEQSQVSVEDLKSRLTRTETDLREAHQEAGKLRSQVSNLQGALDSTSKELAQTKEEARRAETAATELKGQLALLSAEAPKG